MMKLLMSWDIKPGQEEAYFQFQVQELAPSMMELGLQLTEAWYKVYGEGPRMLFGGVTDDLEAMKEVLESEEWQSLHEKLLRFVTNYSHKVVRASNRFQM